MRATTVISQDEANSTLWSTCVITGLTFFHWTIKEKKKKPTTRPLRFLITMYLAPEPSLQKSSWVHSNNDTKEINWEILSKHFSIQAAIEILDSSSDTCYNRNIIWKIKIWVSKKDVMFVVEIWEMTGITMMLHIVRDHQEKDSCYWSAAKEIHIL